MYEWKWSVGEPYYKSGKSRSQLPTKNTILSALSATESNTDTSFPNREELHTKIANRAPIAHRGVNPFLQNNYIHDVSNINFS